MFSYEKNYNFIAELFSFCSFFYSFSYLTQFTFPRASMKRSIAISAIIALFYVNEAFLPEIVMGENFIHEKTNQTKRAGVGKRPRMQWKPLAISSSRT